MPGSSELAELARLPDLAEDVLEEIALGVGVDPFDSRWRSFTWFTTWESAVGSSMTRRVPSMKFVTHLAATSV